jgi:hypothetical protein
MRDKSRDTPFAWYDPVRGYIFHDTEEPAPEDGVTAEQEEADEFYAELKARLDERGPA